VFASVLPEIQLLEGNVLGCSECVRKIANKFDKIYAKMGLPPLPPQDLSSRRRFVVGNTN
jgi:hypothetical protein